jgi:hypothetical protein
MIDRKTLKTVALTVLVMLALIGVWMGAQAVRRGDQPGKQAAAYLDALIRLGQLPTGAQVEQATIQAQAKAQAPAQPQAQAQGQEKK